jgi:uncharacterized coiled-coil protein SlyX
MSNKATIRRNQDRVRLLELQIAVNEKLPPELRCADAIAEMKAEIARLQRHRNPLPWRR